LFMFLSVFIGCGSKKEAVVEEIGIADIKFSPEIPVDVDPAIQQKLKAAGDINALNVAFNDFSWQALVAIMWPTGQDGKPMANFTDQGASAWQAWKEAFQVYRKDGKKPSPWGSPMDASGLKLSADMLKNTEERLVLSTSTPAHKNHVKVANETDQAFAGKLFDQNGNVVVYEVLMNKEEYDYVVTNQLYNINGQIAFSKTNPVADFPAGDYAKKQVGAVEIKFAWKILEATDIKERYYHGIGYIIDSLGNFVKKDLGLIGMHISQKTPTGKQWVWSTFEHIDNLDENVANVNGKAMKIHPTLTDPSCEICPVNVDVSNGTTFAYENSANGPYWNVFDKKKKSVGKYFANSPVMKTQSKRMVDIPNRVKLVNARYQAYFKSINSVWQYYQLIDTQYPLDQDVPPAPHEQTDYILPASVLNKPGGKPNLALLTNISMETFFQVGNQGAGNLIEGSVKSDISIYGTESCMGCHSSAGLYNGYTVANKTVTFNSAGQLSGDFSWLLGKANWDSLAVAPPIK
jgi:hypothetical protein